MKNFALKLVPPNWDCIFLKVYLFCSCPKIISWRAEDNIITRADPVVTLLDIVRFHYHHHHEQRFLHLCSSLLIDLKYLHYILRHNATHNLFLPDETRF